MEQELRKISKYCFGIIMFLCVFWLYRVCHKEDYKYDERTVFAEIQVAEPSMEIIEVDLGQYDDSTYYIFRAPSLTYKIEMEDGFKLIDRANIQGYKKTHYKELSYYSFNENVIYDAKIPQSVIKEIITAINKKKAKSRHFRIYYTIYNHGVIHLEIMEEFHGYENGDKEDVFIYSSDYRAKRIELTDKLKDGLKDLLPFFIVNE